MADFFSNLLLRSSAPASGAILQPRLPSLFESTRGADELPTPHAYASTRNVSLAAPAPVAQVATQAVALTDQPATEKKQQPRVKPESAASMVLPENDTAQPESPVAQEKPSLLAQNKAPGPLLRIPDKVVHALQPKNIFSPLSLEKDALFFDAQPSGPLPVHLEPERTVRVSIERGIVFSAQQAPKTEAAPPRENGKTPQAESRSANAQQVFGVSAQTNAQGQVLKRQAEPVTESPRRAPVEASARSQVSAPLASKAEPGLRPILETHPAQAGLRPLPEPVSSKPVLSKVVVTQPEQARQAESVVQVHIGRIEVRAMTAPAAPPPMPTARSQPKVSLDDYLRRREEKP